MRTKTLLICFLCISISSFSIRYLAADSGIMPLVIFGPSATLFLGSGVKILSIISVVIWTGLVLGCNYLFDSYKITAFAGLFSWLLIGLIQVGLIYITYSA
jgi:hypothetical protein